MTRTVGQNILTGVAQYLPCAIAMCSLASPPCKAETERAGTAQSPQLIPNVAETYNVVELDGAAPIRLDGLEINSTHDGIAGVPSGFTVYENTVPLEADPYSPGAGIRVADDLKLAGGGCDIVYYNLVVGAEQGSATFEVTAELWDGDPCDPNSSPLPNSSATTTFTPGPGSEFDAWNFEVFLNATPVPAPGIVWLAVTLSTDEAIWAVGGPAETGSTADSFSLDDPAGGCGLFGFDSGVHAGFLAAVNCDLAATPTGACCQGTTCSLLTEAECDAVAGFYRGPFTSCTPDPCVPGACCGGPEFKTCTDSNAADCPDGYFTPEVACGADACGQNFRGFANVFNTGIFAPIDLNAEGEPVTRADDITLEPGADCELLCFELLVTGGGEGAPPTYDAHVDLRENVPGDPDVPGEVIPQTGRDFVDLYADLLPKRLVHCVPAGTVLPDTFWITLSTEAPTPTENSSAGPLLGGANPKIGESLDAYAAFDFTPTFTAEEWTGSLFFGGADPTGCPGGAGCTPAGSFQATIWCRDKAPVGACCDDRTESCVDGLTQLDCPGRWPPGVTCASASFVPACGTTACCVPNPITPGDFSCQDLTLSACEAAGGSSNFDLFCIDIADECPTNNCVDGASAGATCASDFDCGAGGTCVGCQNKTGDCFSANDTPGCEDPFCCEAVRATDDFCASGVWDEPCAVTAREICKRRPPNDDVADAEPISTEGEFDFDNTQATMDGPAHAACTSFETGGIANDVYYCWTAPCSATAFFSTCQQPAIDTKVAVYEGCGSPSDATLITCSDDDCGVNERLSFDAVAGSTYLVRIGTYPGTKGGVGTFSLSCGASACPGPGNCCEENPDTVGCSDAECCSTVCACDPFCCGGDTGLDGEWDINCATIGYEGNGCGAELLCPGLCATQTCPTGTVTFLDPVDGIVDAGYPTDPTDEAALLTPDRFTVQAPAGADAVDCWDLCESAATNGDNSVVEVIDNGNGTLDVVLARPMTPGAVTKLTYTANGAAAAYTSHPGNVNGDSAASATDVLSIIDCLNNVDPLGNCPWGDASSDVDRSGVTAPADVLAVIDLFNGTGAFVPWVNSSLPDAGSCAP